MTMIEENPDQLKNDYAALCQRGDALMNLYRFIEASACFERAISLSPENPIAWYGSGKAFMGLAKNKKACVAFDEARMLDPEAYPE